MEKPMSYYNFKNKKEWQGKEHTEVYDAYQEYRKNWTPGESILTLPEDLKNMKPLPPGEMKPVEMTEPPEWMKKETYQDNPTFAKTREALFANHGVLCGEALELMKKKNADYGNAVDPFRNFQHHGELGIMVRMYDKFNRLESFCEKGFNCVESESVKDTIIDMINYSILLYSFLESKGKI